MKIKGADRVQEGVGMSDLEKNIMGENGINYTLGTDGLYYPDSVLTEVPEYEIGRYGMLRKKYLMEHRKYYYYHLLTKCKLHEHLHEIDVECIEFVEKFVRAMAEQDGVNEQMKAEDMMKWVGLMNNFRNMANEIVLNKYVYE